MKIKAYILALSAMALVSEISLKPCMAEDEMQGDRRYKCGKEDFY